MIGAAIAVFLYILGVGAAYAWIHYARGIDRITVADVALLRVAQVRRAMADQQFSSARIELRKKNYREAYLAFATALRRDPDNIPGRIDAAAFFGSIGSIKMEISTLEDGLARKPDDPLLAEKTFGLLTTSGRDRSALDLIRKLYGERASGENAPMVETYRVLATLDTGDEAGAHEMLAARPEIRHAKLVPAALATVLWKSKERVEAIQILADYVASGGAAYPSYAQLATWEAAGGMHDDAVATARKARARFPDDVAARMLYIEMLASESQGSRDAQAEAEAFIRDSKGRPEALAALAELAGRMGWIDMARNLYLVAANRLQDVRMLALYLADAMGAGGHPDDQQLILSQVEAQSEDSSQAFEIQLRRREITSAAARGDPDAERENARYLAAALQSSDPDSVEIFRRLYTRLGYKEALAAFPRP